MSWYRQYRPVTVHQLHLSSVRQTLQEMMASGNFPHAFLFAGPKGTGKTSSARIIAAILNDPANSEAVDQVFVRSSLSQPTSSSKTKKDTATKKISFQEPDLNNDLVQRIQRGSSYVVSELDAASNRGIDDIRQLKERIFLPPQEGKVNIYILDEAHMLTTEAFNALLKILEEPPLHVVFILATTELHKIPDTVASRCMVIRFHKASTQELQDAMTQILTAEEITFEQQALQQLAEAADGSFRDAVKLLEMVAAGKKQLTIADVGAGLQTTQQVQLQELLRLVLEKDDKKVVQFFIELRQLGVDPKFFAQQLLVYLHGQLVKAIMGEAPPAPFSIKIIHYLLTQFSNTELEEKSTIPFLGLELKALEMILKSKEKSGASGEPVSTHQPIVPLKTFVQDTQKEAVTVPVLPVPPPLISEPSVALDSMPINAQQVIEKWEDFLAMVRQKNSSVEALLRSSKPLSSDGEKTQIEVYYQFHREQLQQPKFRSLLDECSLALFGGRVAFEFLLAESSQHGAQLSTVSGKVEEETLIQLAKEILV